MRRTVLILPDLTGSPESESVLRQRLPALQGLSEIGTVFKLAQAPRVMTPEALYLGLGPSEAQMAQGPLTVSALGADPPPRSTHFHLSLLSLDGDAIGIPKHLPTAEEERAIWEAAKRLDTRTLTLLQGEKLDHALVWEGYGEFQTHAPGDLSFKEHLPEGDAETLVRRLIDDSVNLLNELELNQRRLDDGLSPFNILWPWGAGWRVSVPNLSLRRGEPATVESASMRMQGLTRLAGYSHVDRALVGRGMKARFADIAKRCLKRDATIVLLEGPAALRAEERFEELEWFARELDRELLQKLFDDSIANKSRIAVLSPSGSGVGLGLDTATRAERPLPFDERALEERLVPTTDLWNAVNRALLLPDDASR